MRQKALSVKNVIGNNEFCKPYICKIAQRQAKNFGFCGPEAIGPDGHRNPGRGGLVHEIAQHCKIQEGFAASKHESFSGYSCELVNPLAHKRQRQHGASIGRTRGKTMSAGMRAPISQLNVPGVQMVGAHGELT
jgi:hypothetical protein